MLYNLDCHNLYFVNETELNIPFSFSSKYYGYGLKDIFRHFYSKDVRASFLLFTFENSAYKVRIKPLRRKNWLTWSTCCHKIIRKLEKSKNNNKGKPERKFEYFIYEYVRYEYSLFIIDMNIWTCVFEHCILGFRFHIQDIFRYWTV